MRKFKTYPLPSLSLEEAKEIQFQIVKSITKFFNGYEFLSKGDLGVKVPYNRPEQTTKVEKVIADIFNSEDAMLVIGSGTGALRNGINSLSSNKKVLVHHAPIYPTTKYSLQNANINIILTDFNNLKSIEKTIQENSDIDFAIVQYSRQKPDDKYSYKDVINKIKACNKNINILTDDNYAVFKTGNLGIDFGADLSTFSAFKVQGPEGIGVIVGKRKFISKIRRENYSGGSQVQGWLAMEVLQGMTNAPVVFAIQAEQVNQTVKIINKQQHALIKRALVVNAQSKVVVVELKKPIALNVIKQASKFGALPHPVGAESKYEIPPLFYKVSSTFQSFDPNLPKYMIRINPNRAGAIQVVDILMKSLDAATKKRGK